MTGCRIYQYRTELKYLIGAEQSLFCLLTVYFTKKEHLFFASNLEFSYFSFYASSRCAS